VVGILGSNQIARFLKPGRRFCYTRAGLKTEVQLDWSVVCNTHKPWSSAARPCNLET